MTSFQPGIRVQSGSTSSARRYAYGCPDSGSGCEAAVCGGLIRSVTRSSGVHAVMRSRVRIAIELVLDANSTPQDFRHVGRSDVVILPAYDVAHTVSPDRRSSSVSTSPGSPVGLHRVLEPAGVLPQAAERLDDAARAVAGRGPDRGRAAQPRRRVLPAAGRGARRRRRRRSGPAVLDIVASRGKMQNPVTGSGGMLVGVVDEVGPESPLGVRPGDRVATLVSLTLTPLRITDGLARLGRPRRAGAGRRATRSCSPARSSRSCPTTCARALARRAWTCAERRR